MMIFGTAGVGKTTAAISFPKPYVIDTERGAENDQYVDIINRNDGAVFSTTSFDDIVMEVRSLISEEHPYQTLVIDPITVVYDDLVSSWESRVGTQYGAGFKEAKKEWRRLTKLLTKLDMNIVMTSHSKNLYSEGGTMELIGRTFDGPKGADHYMDLVAEIEKEGDKRTAKIVKSRIESLGDGDVVPWSYADLAEFYGRDVLERDATVTEFIPNETIDEINDFLAKREDGEMLRSKWLDAAGVDYLADLTPAQLQGCVGWTRTQKC